MFFDNNVTEDNRTADHSGGYHDWVLIQRQEFPKIGFTITGIWLLCIGLLGFIENILVLLTFMKTKSLRSATNMFIIGLSTADLLMAILGNPLASTASLNGYWFAGDFACLWEGFVVYFLGLSQLYLITAIAVDRYIVIAKPLKASMITKRVAVLAVLSCYLGGLFWCILPLLGWGSYGMESPGVYCGLAWEDESADSYIVAIFFFCFFFPIIVISYCYTRVFLTVKNVARNTVWDMKSRVARKNLKIEKKMLKSVVVMCGSFLFCWTPYAVTSFWQAFGDPRTVSIGVALIPAALAKSQIFLNPIIYVVTNKQFRQAFYKNLPCSGLRDALVKREEVKEQSSKESDDEKKDNGGDTQACADNVNAVAPTGPTKVEC